MNPFLSTTRQTFDIDLGVALTQEQRDRTNNPADGYAVLVGLEPTVGWPVPENRVLPAGTRLFDYGVQPGSVEFLWLVGDDGLLTPSTVQPERGDLVVSLVGLRDDPFFQSGGIITITGPGMFAATEGAGTVVATVNTLRTSTEQAIADLQAAVQALNERAGTDENTVGVLDQRVTALEAAAQQP